MPQPLGEDVPLALFMVVEKVLEKDPAERYQSMREMVVDLRRIARRAIGSGNAPDIGCTRSTVRRIAVEVSLGRLEGLSQRCVAN